MRRFAWVLGSLLCPPLVACGDDTVDDDSTSFSTTTDDGESETGAETSAGDGDGDTGDGDGTSAGDGDGTTTGDGDGTTTGDGDGTTTGDGDGTTTGDGDGTTTGDGDGTTTGDGDGTTTGDGDGTTTGDGDGTTTGDGDGTTTGDGDGTTTGDGDGDGTTTGDGDGDGTTAGDGDGDGTTTGDGDGTTTGDGDGTTTGDGDGTTTGDGDGTTTGDGDGTTTGDGDGTTTGDGDGDGACLNEQFDFDAIPPCIVMVLDKSGSMFDPANDYDHDGLPGTPFVSRWEALHIAVTNVLAQYDGRAEFALKLFPSDQTCGVDPGVDVQCTPDTAAILAAMPPANADLTGATPSGAAIDETLQYLQPLVFPGRKGMIFMADGATTCGLPGTVPEIFQLIEGAYNAGVDPSIPTYVVGVNSNDPATDSELNTYAVAGGFPQGAAGCGWTPFSTVVGPGAHTLEFRYVKDSNGQSGLDAGFVDNILISEGAGTITFSDSFETGDFSGGTYTNSSPVPWVVDTTKASDGIFSAHSGAIGNSATSSLTLDINMALPGSINFDHLEDTEANFDFLEVYIDGALANGPQGWSGAPAGCPARYFDAQDTPQLFSALDQIVADLITCDIDLVPPPPPTVRVEVSIDGTLYDELDPLQAGFDCATDDGWIFLDADTITLCGVACSSFKAMASPVADVDYFCTGA